MDVAEVLTKGPLCPEEAVDLILTIAAETTALQRKERRNLEGFLKEKS